MGARHITARSTTDRRNPLRGGTSQVIAHLVQAVRCGDARTTQELLCRFSALAEFEDLMELRAALEADLCSGPDRSEFRA
ncbi:hypothetical protein SAMN05414137_10260 [Streptacidiphilus jiangxiensis]|uniref:Uncharacterized protein n=1 Tax=Streptacidiphilus jiangxiensis TaxID=235985 RepID=A0A1H7H4X5_STRJI|nr:hypothetical protein SAMN05414137_10260 [Streptacidiphilus jiangxiensis]